MGYDKGLIYTIRSHQTEDIYIGSTTQPLYKRIHQHKKNFKKWKNGKYGYTTSFELLKYDDVYIELLELFPCENKMELHKREGELQREMDCINKIVAGRTRKEWNHDNKDKINEQNKEWRQNNKEIINEYSKEYRQNNKHKKKEYNEEYYNLNKDKLYQKYDCKCGGKYTHQHKSRHLKTKKHQEYILNVEKPLK
jgi:hypothetical protein